VEQEREGEVPTHLKDSSRDKEGFGHGQGYLYPHAFREHWIAQQYLPDALQGRTFYQPSDQGYERGIRDQVARRREAQLAAMVEGESQVEVLTYTVGDRAHDRWLQRTIGNAGERLGRIRDRVLDAARLQRHHVVLDLNAGSGLLTWEILRRAPEGGTWALVQDRSTGEGLRQQVERLPELERPMVIIGSPEEAPDLLALRGETDLRFDAMVGRNALARIPDKAGMLQLLAPWLRPRGSVSLAETIVQHTQRLYNLVDLSPLTDDLQQRVIGAEEQIYADAKDPLVNWDGTDLQSSMEAAGFEEIVLEEETQEAEMLISKATLDRWFATETDLDRPSYGQHLLRRISPGELLQVQALFNGQLANKTVPWQTRLAFVAGRAPVAANRTPKAVEPEL
jgi:putative ATPase